MLASNLAADGDLNSWAALALRHGLWRATFAGLRFDH
jgi:hypothetical protein